MLSAATVLLSLAAAGVQFGSESLPGGGNSYIVQVEPELIDTFRKEGFTSDVPPGLRDIRRIEIRVGNAPLPNQGLTVLKVPINGADAAKARDNATTGDPGAKQAGAAPSKSGPATGEPKKILDAAASPLAGKRDSAVEKTVFQSREKPVALAERSPSSASPSESRADSTKAAATRPDESEWASIPLLGALGALIVSAAGNLYLGWVHMGTRRRYQEVVDQLHETDLPVAIEAPSHHASS
jgi:hypothetical protein